MPSLAEVYLESNKDDKKELLNYRSLVIFITRNLRGSNRAPGLKKIDGQPISIEERIEAMIKFKPRKEKIDPKAYRWKLYLRNYYGQAQIANLKFVSSVKHLALPDCKFIAINLEKFTSLEYLDLSGNSFTKVEGLEKLTR